MNIARFMITFLALVLIPVPLHSWQANTPQGALEEIATADKPEILVRHLPETIQKSIEALPKPKKSEVMTQLMQMRAEKFDNCTVRRAEGGDAWEILDEDGERKGTVKLENAYISGLDALLPLQISSADNSGTLIVTLHLEDNEWRIQDFGHWWKADIGLASLLHEPTEIEKNEEAARQTMNTISNALQSYVQWRPNFGYPHDLQALTRPLRMAFFSRPLLDESYKAEPLIMNGYEFRYLQTLSGNGSNDFGKYELRAIPVEFGKTGLKSFFLSDDSTLRSTSENRPATPDDPRVSAGSEVVLQ